MFGLYSGIASVVIFFVLHFLGNNPFGNARFIGTVVTIVLMVLAHKKFKDSGDGFMSFGEGFEIGFWMVLVSTTISTLIPYLYVTYVDYAPMTMFLDDQLFQMQEKGTPDETIEMAQTWTKKLFWVFAGIGGLIGGVVISLLVSIFTQKRSAASEFN